jgi:hypothetical protein
MSHTPPLPSLLPLPVPVKSLLLEAFIRSNRYTPANSLDDKDNLSGRISEDPSTQSTKGDEFPPTPIAQWIQKETEVNDVSIFGNGIGAETVNIDHFESPTKGNSERSSEGVREGRMHKDLCDSEVWTVVKGKKRKRLGCVFELLSFYLLLSILIKCLSAAGSTWATKCVQFCQGTIHLYGCSLMTTRWANFLRTPPSLWSSDQSQVERID